MKIPQKYLPTEDEVKKYLTIWNNKGESRDNDNALYKLFQEICPENKDIRDVLIKCSALNEFYSTNVYYIHEVALHILKQQNIDERLKKGDPTLVDQIADVKSVNRKYYSFATKYCSFHYPYLYPIYDNFVENVLWEFKKRDGFSDFKRGELRNYERYKEIIDDFRNHYGLSDFTYKELDMYLWQLGKQFYAQ